MTKDERKTYYHHLYNIMAQNGVFASAFDEGLAENRAFGLAEGRAIGRAEGQAVIILHMLESGMPPEQISSLTGFPIEEITNLKV